MSKTKKVLAGAFAIALAAPMFATPVFAATETGTADVSYDNTNSIPDPEHPDQPGWAVKIPSTIVFTDANPLLNVGVELIAVHGGTLPTTDVTVTVASANAYKLQLGTAGTDDVPYVLQYGGTTMNNTTHKTVGTLNQTTTTIAGTATLNGTAQQTGDHTDTLTYTIDNGTV